MSQTLAKALNRNAPQITEDERKAGEKTLEHIEQNIDRTLYKYDDEESLERLAAMDAATTAAYIWPMDAVRQMRRSLGQGIVPTSQTPQAVNGPTASTQALPQGKVQQPASDDVITLQAAINKLRVAAGVGPSGSYSEADIEALAKRIREQSAYAQPTADPTESPEYKDLHARFKSLQQEKDALEAAPKDVVPKSELKKHVGKLLKSKPPKSNMPGRVKDLPENEKNHNIAVDAITKLAG